MDNKPSYEELKKSEENYRNLFNNNPLSLWEEDFSNVFKLLDDLKSKGISISKEYFDKTPSFFNECISAIKILNINKATLDLFKYKSKEELIKNILLMFNAKAMETIKNELVAIANNKIFFAEETELVRADGKIISVIVQFQVIESRRKLVFTITDITGRKKAEKALIESEDRFKAFSEATYEGIFISQNGIIIDVNEAACKTTGYTCKEMTGMCATDFIAAESKEIVKNNMKKGYEKPYDAIAEMKNGTKLYVEIQGRMLEYKGKTVRVAAVRDISERKRVEKVMLKASRMKAASRLAAGIAHDFNNLMVGVLGNADLLKMQYIKEPDTIDKLNTIAESACKASDLAQQLLAFAKAGKYQPKILNLNDFIKDMLRLNEQSFPSRIKIKLNMEEKLFNIKADFAQMNQVVMNICINSVESIEKDGSISISTYNIDIEKKFALSHPPLKTGNYICLSIEDTGCGMDKNTLSNVFEPFFSIKSTGRGLGMAAVYGIIENHGGYVSVHSEVGIGTIFKIYLPAVDSEVFIEKKPENDISIGTETILIIDDEIMVLDVTKNILENFGYEVLLAHDGKEALDIIKNFDSRIHLALLDMAMPVMGGLEAFHLIKKINSEIKIIICSGYDLDSAAQSLLDAGANSFIQKPFSMNKMLREIRMVLDIS